jgi:hypothetical protein
MLDFQRCRSFAWATRIDSTPTSTLDLGRLGERHAFVRVRGVGQDGIYIHIHIYIYIFSGSHSNHPPSPVRIGGEGDAQTSLSGKGGGHGILGVTTRLDKKL